MNNYLAVVEYDGTNYKGFQSQPGNTRTIQGELLKSLATLTGPISGFGYAGRTDAGVHARHQVINFKTDSELDLYRFKWKMNCILPVDIVIRTIKKVHPDFDSRRDARIRQYAYYIVNNNYQSVFWKKYSLLVTGKLDIAAMREAAGKFIGVKDFTTFCSDNLHQSFNMREVYSCSLGKHRDGLLIFKISANSFLYNMVRIITGTLLEVGRGKRNPESISSSLEGRNRKLAGKIVPPMGLFLTDVVY